MDAYRGELVIISKVGDSGGVTTLVPPPPTGYEDEIISMAAWHDDNTVTRVVAWYVYDLANNMVCVAASALTTTNQLVPFSFCGALSTIGAVQFAVPFVLDTQHRVACVITSIAAGKYCNIAGIAYRRPAKMFLRHQLEVDKAMGITFDYTRPY